MENQLSDVKLAANRNNAKRSTGPKSALGKAKSASNSLQHGFYSLRNFENFVHDNDVALAVTQNYLEQFAPVTPTEHTLVHQMIQLELRFLQMQFLYDQAMAFRVEDLLNKPVSTLPLILRELDRIPYRLEKAIRLLRAELALRDEQTLIEPIADHPKLPALPDSAYYDVVQTPEGRIAVEQFKKQKIETKPPLTEQSHLTGEEVFQIFTESILNRYPKPPR